MKSLLNISDLSQNDINHIFDLSLELESKKSKPLENKNIGMLFEKYSTRTRLSFHTAITSLGGDAVKLDFNEMNIQRIESFEDTFEILSCYLDMIVYRTNNHHKLEIAQKYFQKPIINALSDISHPCQAISDIYTLKVHFGNIDNISILWFGDLNNVLFSLCELTNLLGNINIDIFTDRKIYNDNKKRFNFNNLKFNFEIDEKILSHANCIMTDVYTSMNDSDDSKENLLKKFQVNSEVMSLTRKDAVFMHCLPAHIGSEVTKDVIKGSKSITLIQAYNRMVAQKGILQWLNL
tara:strand:+ start:6870 stop:7748 length:879 start_codon:yes stop_codon:yes gene_type:complete